MLGRIKKVAEEVAVFVPAGNAGACRLPLFVGSKPEINDEVIRPLAGLFEAVFAAQQIADGVVNPRGKILKVHSFFAAHVDARFDPSFPIIGIVSQPLEAILRPLLGDVLRKGALEFYVAFARTK